MAINKHIKRISVFISRHRILVSMTSLVMLTVICASLEVKFFSHYLNVNYKNPHQLEMDLVEQKKFEDMITQAATIELATEYREISAEELVMLNEALKACEETIILQENKDGIIAKSRLKLMNVLHEIGAKKLALGSIEAETLAYRLLSMQKNQEATNSIIKAIQMQREINVRFYLSSAYDHERLKILQTNFDNMIANRIYKDSIAAEENALIALKQHHYERAETKYLEALHLANELNFKYPGSRFNLPTRRATLKLNAASIKHYPYTKKIEELMSKVTIAIKNNQLVDARTVLNEAINLQEKLISKFPDSINHSKIKLYRLKAELNKITNLLIQS